jgi:hypothetical protein
MASYETNLSNQRLFNVGVTRVREELTMIVDDKAKLARQLASNPGNKTSAMETTGRLNIDNMAEGRRGRPPGGQDVGLPDGPTPGGSDRSQGLGVGRNKGQPGAAASGRTQNHPTENLPSLPERSLGLDL